MNRLCDYLANEEVIVEGKKYSGFEVQVILPNTLQHDMQASADDYFKVNKFNRQELQPARGRAIRTRAKEDSANPNKLIICDIPTTLSAVFDAIVMYLHVNQTETKEFKLIERREINNFTNVIEQKINRDPFRKRIVRFIEFNF